MSLRKAAVITAGSWGTGLASVLADNDFAVTLYTRTQAQADEINDSRRNGKYTGDFVLSERITATASMEEALSGAGVVLFVSPSHAMRQVARQARPYVLASATVIHATKGFEPETMKRMTTVLAEELPHLDPSRLVVLSGPSHAEEVVQRRPTTVVVAADCLEAAEQAQDVLINPYFRVYTNPDVIGVEVGGALKNIIALGAGLSDGLGFGDNAKAALLTRGLAEIARLGASMGGHALTFSGLAGVGDLVVTCTSQHSRNWRAGYLLGQGRPLDEVLETMGMVVEGVKTTKTAYALSKQYEVSMPITEQLHEVLFAGKEPQQAVGHLMGRGRTHENEELADAFGGKWIL
ncbi:NAD(P)H-dependent glycerol-3-phosphate dehydrogenase [Paenibacillus hodogayensis]|uniref:Glycerol-3-phosphate dehydrogenase [NAD(P)+] n=1 Tax=Paenibacillus hodogayensis TaxID=279208 RepID=A0ABV5W4R4_9BACL